MTDKTSIHYPENWSHEQREEYKQAYLAGEAVEMPFLEHEPGTCDHCDALRTLIREADDD